MSKLKLFPPYLDVGSTGTAVAHLQAILCSMGSENAIVRDGKYREATAAAVKNLQKFLGFSRTDVDGNFGPVTRRALHLECGINVDLIPYSKFYDAQNTWRSPNFEGDRGWKGGTKQDIADLKKDKKE